ncbi:nicotinate-nucleotide adenylyltransferase [Actibacterium lipolyticum]|uniref:Probable nicotinate-nucleotide adenylyltransferase n=1 Tax=Actibacterium lipolyticum TaxID=1524263 RepID=A0A238JLL9_9RHOB|nr:nicotinate-nucleotide adenylyltransferase [Actibacterium lipolyticum]SMX31541.1 Nicotinate-nucleotide adenylyltransferase [Actibacterium lipolyticum]
MRHSLPHAAPGQIVGLLGGSFDPAHDGHAHITKEALKRFGLDQVWWLVSPGNPLKAEGPAPMAQRLDAARRVIAHPRVKVTDIEATIGTRYTAATLSELKRLYPSTRFVWLMGADNLATFHKWDRWEWIMENVPIGVIARPGLRLSARVSKAAERYARYRIPARASFTLGRCDPPAWCFVNIPMVNISSTEIRAKGGWAR